MKGDKLKRLRLIYICIMVFLVISAFVIPYNFLNSINSFKGAFLFWSIFALTDIYLTIKITSYWGDN
ncbi:hypothetical protein DFR78_1133 [Halanaerobium sp. MA284_MarDTE_T2]|nr:hypothetical protein DFR78_1133 [Halanaerobium sp. MA284_MarDTE_T2]RCW84875.1 hypothetical protein DER71_1123 [Halanaerobium sp. DL-01]